MKMRRALVLAGVFFAALAFANKDRGGRDRREDAIARVVAGAVDGASRALLDPVKTDEATRFVVELDPGHGGTNTGASGVLPGVYEKRITLAIARMIAARLEGAPGVVVLMTRADDRFVSLRERVRQANRDAADVLVSLHLNASPTKAQRGFETWVLTPESLGDARALRVGDGPVRDGVPAEAALILDDVERASALPGAVELASIVQKHLDGIRGAANDRGVRQGTQDVLIGPVMPAILVEAGFIDHAEEGRELTDRAVLESIAGGIADAILEYKSGLDSAHAAP
jgi:N-acetylmuramoyl-L-alanine amidase